MKIAIIGAGITGLACAHELELYGLKPVIYEDLNFIGDREPHVTAIISVADRPIKEDLLDYFRNTCHLDITALNPVKKLTHHSPNKTTVIRGKNFGYFLLRGKDENALKGQIYSQLSKTKVILSKKPDYKALSKKYDFVVVANGLPDITKECGCWRELISGWIKGAVVEGSFDQNELIMWINRKYCKNGYAYLCPYDNKRASLSVFVPYVDEKELEYYWEQFLSIEKLQYSIIEEFSVEHFSGYVSPHKLGNIYFAGTAGGGVSPFLGFGQVNGISMGVFAAQSIVEGLDYEKLIKDILEKEDAFYELRKSFDKLTNNDYDSLVKSIGFLGIKQLTYHTNFNMVKFLGHALKIKSKLLKK